MKFNPDEYETVKSRKERFYKDHPDGRIVAELVNDAGTMLEYVVFRASCYLTAEDQEKGLPRGVGYALEVRDKELSVSRDGQKYESVNYSSWTENCEESAVGRCLDNAGYSGNKKPSREEMKKAQGMAKTMGRYNDLSKSPDDKNNEFKDSACQHCGGRIAISKNGSPYCTNKCWLPEGAHFREEFKKK